MVSLLLTAPEASAYAKTHCSWQNMRLLPHSVYGLQYTHMSVHLDINFDFSEVCLVILSIVYKKFSHERDRFVKHTLSKGT